MWLAGWWRGPRRAVGLAPLVLGNASAEEAQEPALLGLGRRRQQVHAPEVDPRPSAVRHDGRLPRRVFLGHQCKARFSSDEDLKPKRVPLPVTVSSWALPSRERGRG